MNKTSKTVEYLLELQKKHGRKYVELLFSAFEACQRDLRAERKQVKMNKTNDKIEA